MSVRSKSRDRKVIRVYHELYGAFHLWITDIRFVETRSGGFILKYWDDLSYPSRWVKVGRYPEPLTWKSAVERVLACEDELVRLPIYEDLAEELPTAKITGISGWQADMILLALAYKTPEGCGDWLDFLLELPEEEIQILAKKYGRIVNGRVLRILNELAREAWQASMYGMSIRQMASKAGVENPWDFRKLKAALRRYAPTVVGAAECIRYRHAEYVPAQVLENLLWKPEPADVCRRAELFELWLKTRFDEYQKPLDVLRWILGDQAEAVFRLVKDRRLEALIRFLYSFLAELSKKTKFLRDYRGGYISIAEQMMLGDNCRWANRGLQLIGAAKAVGMAIPAELDISEQLQEALARLGRRPSPQPGSAQPPARIETKSPVSRAGS